MISIALRNLTAERTRFAISVAGVAFSVMLILVILSLYQGWRVKSTEYIRNVDTDLWVTQKGSADITNSASILSPLVGEELKNIKDVETVDSFLGRPVQFELKGKDVNAYIVAFDPEKPITGPKKMLSGTYRIQKGEIVIDKVLALIHNIQLGDKIDVLGTKLKVVGIAEGANMFLFQFSFVTQAEAKEILQTGELTNYYLVKVNSGAILEVQSQINKLDGVQALTQSEFVDKNRQVIDEVFIPIISVLVFISLIVGTTIIGLTIYTSTIEKSREFGVLKAIGGSNGQIYRIIFEQALISGLVGYFIGVVMTLAFLQIIPNFVPVFVTETNQIDLLVILVMALLMSIIASYTPVRRIVKIDPALVFKS